MPKDINDLEGTFEEIKRIRPIAVPVKQGDARSNDAWSVTRRLIHTMEFTANPGRNIKFYVKDEVITVVFIIKLTNSLDQALLEAAITEAAEAADALEESLEIGS